MQIARKCQEMTYTTEDGRTGKVAYAIFPLPEPDGRMQVVFSKIPHRDRRPVEGSITGLAAFIVRSMAKEHQFDVKKSIVTELQTYASNPESCRLGAYRFVRIAPDWDHDVVRIWETFVARDVRVVTELFSECIESTGQDTSPVPINPRFEDFRRDYLAMQH